MKKLFLLLIAVFALSATTFAQRIAVVDFNAGVGISQQDVDGIAAIFNTYFSPSGYTLVERTTIDRVIDEQQFQRGKITEQQMVRLGQILNVSKIVIGDVNVVAGEYNIDVRVVNVETGTIVAREGGTWMQCSTYRELMCGIAARLASQISINVRPVGYKVGDCYDVNGVKGVVFAASPDGSHGRVISCKQWLQLHYTDIDAVLRELGDGWRLPTKQEFEVIYTLKNSKDFNDGLFWMDAPAMRWQGCYWGRDPYMFVYEMEDGSALSSQYHYYEIMRAVYAF